MIFGDKVGMYAVRHADFNSYSCIKLALNVFAWTNLMRYSKMSGLVGKRITSVSVCVCVDMIWCVCVCLSEIWKEWQEGQVAILDTGELKPHHFERNLWQVLLIITVIMLCSAKCYQSCNDDIMLDSAKQVNNMSNYTIKGFAHRNNPPTQPLPLYKLLCIPPVLHLSVTWLTLMCFIGAPVRLCQQSVHGRSHTREGIMRPILAPAIEMSSMFMVVFAFGWLLSQLGLGITCM